MKILRVFDLPPEIVACFNAGRITSDEWEQLYRQQCDFEEQRAEQVRKDYVAGLKIPDTPFNRRALELIWRN